LRELAGELGAGVGVAALPTRRLPVVDAVPTPMS
jgi:hypothetical protein